MLLMAKRKETNQQDHTNDVCTQAEMMLRTAGLRCSQGRVRILTVMLRAGRPVSAQDIANSIARRPLDKVSIYRALEAFVANEIVHRAFMQDRTWYFEPAHRCGRHRCHPHFTCQQCGETTCMVHVSFPLVRGLDKGYVLDRQTVHITGTCPRCNRRAAG